MGPIEQDPPSYSEFAAQTYASINRALDQALCESNGGSILMSIGEAHHNLSSDDQNPENEQNPALAGAFSEVSALAASQRLVGTENTVLAVELLAEDISYLIDGIENNNLRLDDFDVEATMAHAILYAHRNGIEIVPIEADADVEMNAPERDEMMIDSIRALSLTDEQKIIVHVGGAAHMSNMAGFNNDTIENTTGVVTLDPDNTPSSGSYDDVVFVNTVMLPEDYVTRLEQNSPQTYAEVMYFTDPDNAIQIDPPGKMRDEYRDNIGYMIDKAADDFAAQNTQQNVPDNAVEPNDMQLISPKGF